MSAQAAAGPPGGVLGEKEDGIHVERPARHPQVTFTNAITSCPAEHVTRCYPDTQAAFEAAATERPYNNTSLSLGWCTENHDTTKETT